MNEKMTITEALAEIKLMEKKVQKKKETISANLTRHEDSKDPFEADGGTAKFILASLQSVRDLNSRLERIRTAIAAANLKTEATVAGKTKSVYSWLVWKREIAEGFKKYIADIASAAHAQIQLNAQRPQVLKNEKGEITGLSKLLMNVDYPSLVNEAMAQQEMLDSLDGKLSLINATTVIEF